MRDHVTKFERENPERGRFIWDFTAIKEILSNPVYIGAIASQKVNYRFKIGWIGDKQREDWIIVEGMREAIQRISEDNFNRILENSQTEQATLKNRVTLNRERLAQQTQEQEDSTRWLEIIPALDLECT